MKNIFPQEIIKLSVENHFSKYSKGSYLIYLSAILFLSTAIGSLFLLKTEITVQSRGFIRSSGEPILITAPLTAEVKKSVLKENLFVNEGDTLIWLNSNKLKEKIKYFQNSNL